MKTIKLTQGKSTLVDDCDYEWLNQWQWVWAAPRWGRGSGYACRHFTTLTGVRIRVFMHQILLPWRVGLEVDHQDSNGLNNQRGNLRHATRAQQCQSKSPHYACKYKGVKTERRGPLLRYRASISVGNTRIHSESFLTAEQAALAYNELALKHFGKFARLNENVPEPIIPKPVHRRGNRLNDSQIRTIRTLVNTGLSRDRIASQFGICGSLVSQIARRELYRHVD